MPLKVISFGQIAAITGNELVFEEKLNDTDSLKVQLHKKFPDLVEMKYALAVDKKLVQENTELSGVRTVALLPPFSGG